MARIEKPVESRLVLHCPGCGYDITGEWQVADDPERRKSVADREQATHARGFELGGERPIGQYCIEPPGRELLAQQRRGAEALEDPHVEIEAELRARIKAQHEPALIYGTAGDPQPLPGKAGDIADRRSRRDNQGADRAGVRYEGQIATLGPLPRKAGEIGDGRGGRNNQGPDRAGVGYEGKFAPLGPRPRAPPPTRPDQV